MRAVRIRNPASLDALEYVEVSDPDLPGKGEIQVRLRASSLNFHDYSIANGRIPTADGRIPMSDGAGEVLAVGEGVTHVAAGDLVMSTFFPVLFGRHAIESVFRWTPGDGTDGFARELVTAPATWFTQAPCGWTAAEAATLPCAGLTAWRALIVEGRMKPGDSVLVMGTGGVSIFALQIAKAAGCAVIATSSSDEKLERLTAMGADAVINYKADPEWGKTVKDLTGGQGVDHIVEIGGAGTLPQSLAACGRGGHIGLIGGLAGYSVELLTAAIVVGQLRVSGILVGTPLQQEDFVAALEVNNLKPVIDRHFSLAELANAFRYQASGQHFGKVVIDI